MTTKIQHGQRVQITGEGLGWRFLAGTVEGIARRDGRRTPEQAVARCLKMAKEDPHAGHVLAWLNAEATVLSDSPQAAWIPDVRIAIGDEVEMEGRRYRTVRAPNRNVELVAL